MHGISEVPAPRQYKSPAMSHADLFSVASQQQHINQYHFKLHRQCCSSSALVVVLVFILCLLFSFSFSFILVLVCRDFVDFTTERPPDEQPSYRYFYQHITDVQQAI